MAIYIPTRAKLGWAEETAYDEDSGQTATDMTLPFGIHDEDVDLFYGCSLCQSFAPTSVCVITPDRIALCGAINWFDGRAAAKVDPEGPQFAIEKGECLDER